MKTEERQKLKSNELEETINKEVEYLRDHWQQGLTVIAVIMIGIGGYMWVSQIIASSKSSNQEGLQNAIVQLDILKMQAASQASLGDDPESLSVKPYDPSSLVANLNEVSGDSIDMMAALKKADAIRSQLYYKSEQLSDSEKAEIIKNASALYEQVKTEYSDGAFAVGEASIGLGLIAEDKGDLDAATKIYQAIIDDTEKLFAGTIYPTKAQKRLKELVEFDMTIKFAPAPPEVIAVPTVQVPEDKGAAVGPKEKGPADDAKVAPKGTDVSKEAKPAK